MVVQLDELWPSDYFCEFIANLLRTILEMQTECDTQCYSGYKENGAFSATSDDHYLSACMEFDLRSNFIHSTFVKYFRTVRVNQTSDWCVFSAGMFEAHCLTSSRHCRFARTAQSSWNFFVMFFRLVLLVETRSVSIEQYNLLPLCVRERVENTWNSASVLGKYKYKPGYNTGFHFISKHRTYNWIISIDEESTKLVSVIR